MPIFTETCACAAPPSAAAKTVASNILLNVIGFSLVICCWLDAEIGVKLVEVSFKFGVGDHVNDPALLDHIVPVGDSRSKAEILLNQHNGKSLALEAGDGAADLLDDDRGQAFGRLVE